MGDDTPLGNAAMCTQPEGAAACGVRLLVAAGADATAKDGSGWTALHDAARYGRDDPSVAGLLLGAGCDPATKNSNGKAALGIAHRNNKPRMAALLEAAAADPEATLAPFRAEVAALRQLVKSLGLEAGLASALLPEPEKKLAMADAMGRADLALPGGTRICVAGRGRGAYVRFGKKTFGANEHTIAFDSGETSVVNLKKETWTVKAAEMDAMDTPPEAVPLSITVSTITGHHTELDVRSLDTIGAVKAMIEEKDGVPVARQRLLFRNQPLDDDGATLGGIGVAGGATIHLIMQADDAEPEPEPGLSRASSVGLARQLSAEARQGAVAAREAERAAQADTAAAAAELAEARREIAKLRQA